MRYMSKKRGGGKKLGNVHVTSRRGKETCMIREAPYFSPVIFTSVLTYFVQEKLILIFSIFLTNQRILSISSKIIHSF